MRTVRLTVGLESDLTMANLLNQQRYITEVIAPAARVYQSECKRQDGYNMVHGRPHGFAWKPIYGVTVEFESKEAAQEFFDAMHDGEKVISNG